MTENHISLIFLKFYVICGDREAKLFNEKKYINDILDPNLYFLYYIIIIECFLHKIMAKECQGEISNN